MKRIFLFFSLVFSLFVCDLATAQSGHTISGLIIDTTKLSVPGATVKIKTEKGDSTIRVTGIDGKFVFTGVQATKLTLTVTSIGYEGIVKHFVLGNDTKSLELGNVTLKSESKLLSGVTILGITPVTLKEDTTQYSAAAYKVRENAPVEDLVKKLPGVEVDNDGTITTKGKAITKIRINGKDVFGGDLQSITKNLPADVVENIQMIDDYGDQANLTGIKTGEPDQIMNITIRQDKNYGYSLNATGGAGKDALPSPQPNSTRYEGLVNSFSFNGSRQISILGNLNNVNANTFGFGGQGGGGGGNADGITNVHTGGINYRDQWGPKLSVYGSYSVADNTTNTDRFSTQDNFGSFTDITTSHQSANSVNHRFTWNMEYKPDTLNYLKIMPNYSYSNSTTHYNDEVASINSGDTLKHYTSNSLSHSNSPNFGTTVLYNHRFKASGRNLNVYISANSSHSDQDQNQMYDYSINQPTINPDRLINTGSRITSIGTSLSYLEPLSKVSFLELNYAFNHSHTTSEKETDTLSAADVYEISPLLSNDYNYNFTTNKVGLNYRFIEQKYNYTLGVGVQPAVLDGFSPSKGTATHVSTFNIIPTARYIYNFAKNSSFSANYNGSSVQPSFDQLQPVTDYSNDSRYVQGNAFLKPSFRNNFFLRYNRFSFETGDTFFLNARFSQVNNSIVSNSKTYSSNYTIDPKLAGKILTTYQNADGYYTADGRISYSKPWDERKFTLSFNGRVSYTNDIGYNTTVDAAGLETTRKNISKNLQYRPGLRFRVDINDVIDAQLNSTYAINQTNNTDPQLGGVKTRQLEVDLNGKNYFWNDWTFSYDFSHNVNYGYTQKVTNPNILNLYVERRFLKNNMATIRISGNDLFNQNAGYSITNTSNYQNESSVNRLGRYFLVTLNIRLQKFAGKAPSGPDDLNSDGGGGRGRRGGGGGRGGRGGGSYGGGF